MNSKVSRRAFLIGVTGSAVAAAAGCRPGGMTIPTQYAPGSATLTPVPTGTSEPTRIITPNAPADANYGEIVFDEIFSTPVDKFYVTQYDYNKTPDVDIATWTLKIDGLVENPVTLTYDEVKARPAVEDMRTLECIGNPVGGALIGNTVWKGFALAPVLEAAKISPKATHARFYAADGYHTAVALKWITDPGTLLVYEMGGAPLNKTHGFPLRIMMPGLYGQKMPRWLTRIEFIDYDYIGYWESNGYSNIASVNNNSQIKSPPADGGSVSPVTVGRKVQIQGVAYSAPRLITKVEVQINNGEWMPAKITQGKTGLVWTQWRFEWIPPTAGSYTIAVRATDDSGFVQFKKDRNTFADTYQGTSVIHEITVKAAAESA
jgi:DMSO/TMAO reductase YedYZ molybdopterin-dependent catalytic subunit